VTSAAAARRRARARRTRTRRDLARIAAGLVALVALAAIYAALNAAAPIREVVVSGAARTTVAEVRAAAALEGASVFRASSRDAEARILALPAIRRARVTIQLPDRAFVEVEERRPAIALSSAGGRVLADVDGALFPAGGSENLTTLEDETARRSAGERIDPALVSATLAIASREPPYFGRAIERIRLTVSYGFVAMLAGPVELRLGAPDQMDLKLETARQIVLSRAGKRLDYVDVRNRENPVYFPAS
jgi:cell division septal protein FtsQ